MEQGYRSFWLSFPHHSDVIPKSAEEEVEEVEEVEEEKWNPINPTGGRG